MKKLFTLIILAVFALGANAQLELPITFEEEFSDTLWLPFANGATEIPRSFLSVELNPMISSLNSSDSVLQFVVNDDADAWVGMYSDHVGAMEFTADAHTLSVMVLKTVISPMRFKLEQSLNGGEINSVEVSNTKVDEWELVSFPMVDAVGYYYSRLVFFPDFPATREGGSTIFIDNMANFVDVTSVNQFSAGELKVFPNPVDNRMSVQFPEMNKLTVSNVLGQTIKSIDFQTSNSKVIELGDLKSGIYYVTAITKNGNYTTTFLKK